MRQKNSQGPVIVVVIAGFLVTLLAIRFFAGVEYTRPIIIALGPLLLIFLYWKTRKSVGAINPETGMPYPVHVEGVDENLDTIDFGALTRIQAEPYLLERFANAGKFYEEGGESMVNTTITFCRGVDHYIYIDFLAPNEIHVTAGAAANGTRKAEEIVLPDFEALAYLIDCYYRQAKDFQHSWQKLSERNQS